MKVYDKEIYNKQESIKTIVVGIVVFLLGFFAGYMAHSFNQTHTPEETKIIIIFKRHFDNAFIFFCVEYL